MPPEPGREPWTPSRVLAWTLVVLVGALLVEVLFEGWVETLVGTSSTGYGGRVILTEAAWPKLVKNGLYLTLAGLSVAKVAIDGRWRDFSRKADLALVALALVLVLAGLVSGSSLPLIGQALFVYLRGVIVFYALRAADPPWPRLRPVLWTVGGLVALNVVVALVQMVVGPPAYSALGWVDLSWGEKYRSQALLTHPNHLGHLLALAILGVLAWLGPRARLGYRPWIVLGVLGLTLSATQSREAIIAVCVAAGVLCLLGGIGVRRTVAAVALILVFAGAQVALRPDNRAEWNRRLTGVVDAFRVPSGAEAPRTPAPSPTRSGPAAPPSTHASASTHTSPSSQASPSAPASPSAQASPSSVGLSPSPAAAPTTPAREIRVLYYQQGLRLLAHRPLLGYGVGQFGGIVAEKNDPNWNLNPAFGPGGFDRHGFQAKQVDSFWLHLVVEAGLLGLLAYLVWLAMLAAPLLRRTSRFGGAGPSAPADPFAYWALAAIVFVVQVAFLSASLEDPLLPAILFAILGLAWLYPGRDSTGLRS